MEIKYNIISLVDLFGLFQGLFLGTTLFLESIKKGRARNYLALFIILYALEFIPGICEDTELISTYPELSFLPFRFIWLQFALFFVYVQKVSIIETSKVNYWILIPGILEFFMDTVIFVLPMETKIAIHDSLWYNTIAMSGVCYSIGIAIATIRWINRHVRLLKNQYSSVAFKELRWARLFIFFGLLSVFSVVLYDLFFENFFYFDLTWSIVNVGVLYWIFARGVVQRSVPTLVKQRTLKGNSFVSKRRLQESSNDSADRKLKTLLLKLDQFMIEKEPYVKNDLTVLDVAKSLNVKPKQISSSINICLQKNFNSYVNSFRVRKAKEILLSEYGQTWSNEGIGFHAGFQSKSTFYEAFKRHTGFTPARFREKMKE